MVLKLGFRHFIFIFHSLSSSLISLCSFLAIPLIDLATNEYYLGSVLANWTDRGLQQCCGPHHNVAGPDPSLHIDVGPRIRFFSLLLIRIRLFSLMRMRIRLFLLMRIRIRLFSLMCIQIRLFSLMLIRPFLWCGSGSDCFLWCGPDRTFLFDADLRIP